MLHLDSCVERFFHSISSGEIEIYNEFSLQHEFGIYLRSILPQAEYKVQFERPAAWFGASSPDLSKKEIDIAAFRRDGAYKVAVELKFPRNGQYPEQMFKACQDLMFLEQLVTASFNCGLFVMAADDRLFWEGKDRVGLYSCFRATNPIVGFISKPTGDKDEAVTLKGSYLITWHKAGLLRYFSLTVTGTTRSNDAPGSITKARSANM